MDSIVGQSGLEEAYDDLLRGQDGQLLINTGLDGAVRATIQQRTATPGATLVLTLDASLQATLQQALRQRIETLQSTAMAGGGRECRAGAAVVVDVKTGGILAAANWPGYDLNNYRSDYAALSADAGAPLLDRAFQGLYAPGSAFKPAVAAAALTAGFRPRRHRQLHGTLPVLQRLPARLPAVRPRRAGRHAHRPGTELQHLFL